MDWDRIPDMDDELRQILMEEREFPRRDRVINIMMVLTNAGPERALLQYPEDEVLEAAFLAGKTFEWIRDNITTNDVSPEKAILGEYLLNPDISIRDLASKYKITSLEVFEILRKGSGHVLGGKVKALTPNELKALDMYAPLLDGRRRPEFGKKLSAIAKECHMAYTTIYRIIADAGLPTRREM